MVQDAIFLVQKAYKWWKQAGTEVSCAIRCWNARQAFYIAISDLREVFFVAPATNFKSAATMTVEHRCSFSQYFITKTNAIYLGIRRVFEEK